MANDLSVLKRFKPKQRKIRITRRWVTSNLSLICVALLLVTVAVAASMTGYYSASVSTSLQIRAISTAQNLTRYNSDSYSEFFDYSRQLAANFTDADKLEMQIIDEYGRIMFSSTGLTAGFVPTTSDVATAMQTGVWAPYTGYDPLTDEKVMSITAPVFNSDNDLIGAVRYVTSLKLLDQQIRNIYLTLAGAFFALVTLVLISNSFFLRSIVAPVIQINEFAQKITGGQYGARLDFTFNDEIGELCQTLNHMSEELSRMDTLKNDFISSVSHELRTPLTAIHGWSETIAAAPEDKEMAAAGLEIIKNETRRLSQMVEELLDLSRIESGKLTLRTERFDIRGVLYDAIFTYNEMLKKAGLKVNYTEPEQEIPLAADKNRLKQVFLNIIDNAGKYGKDGSAIDVSVRQAGDFCIIQIRDYGQGIPESELPYVKDKFFKGSAKGRGTGIGLAVCDEIVTQHGGTLDIFSTFGEGTEVVITLPTEQTENGEL